MLTFSQGETDGEDVRSAVVRKNVLRSQRCASLYGAKRQAAKSVVGPLHQIKSSKVNCWDVVSFYVY